MESIFHSLLMLMIVVWIVAVIMRKIGLPTIMGVVIGPAVLGWVTSNAVIENLAHIGIFFLMLHTGVETEPREFYSASFGIALIVAIVPFSASMGVALLFGLDIAASIFVGLTLTATAVVITLKILRNLGFNITFDLPGHLTWFLVVLTFTVIFSQILSAGYMATCKHFSWIGSLAIGVGHCARAEMAFIIASLGIEMGVLEKNVFSILVFTAFLLNMATPLMLKACATLLEKPQPQRTD